MKNILFLGLITITTILFSLDSMSAEIKLGEKISLQTYNISANGVNGVEIILTKEATMTDCNRFMIVTDLHHLRGSLNNMGEPNNIRATYQIEANVAQTAMGCDPIPSTKVILQTELKFSSMSGGEDDRQLQIKLLVPSDYTLTVQEY